MASVPSSWQRAANAHFAVGEQDSYGIMESLGGCGFMDLYKSVLVWTVLPVLPVPLLNCTLTCDPFFS